jgi:hypothetical protein
MNTRPSTRTIAVCVIGVVVLGAIGISLTTPPAAGFLGFLGDTDWEPPEKGIGMSGLSDSEYISLWGRTSSQLEGVSDPDKINDTVANSYDGFVSTPEERSTYIAYFVQGAATEKKRTSVMEWNRGLNSLATNNDPPMRGTTSKNTPQIQTAYYQIARPSPHTIFAHDGSRTSYVGDRVFLSGIVNLEYDSRPYRQRPLANYSTMYWISDIRYKNFNMSARSNGTTVDTRSLAHPLGYASLDLSAVDHNEPVSFSASGTIEVEETAEDYRMECNQTEVRNYSWRGYNYSYQVCVDYNRIVLDTRTINKTVTVGDTLTGYNRYEPTIQVDYAVENRADKEDLYYLDIKTQAPIEGVDTGSEFIDFGTGYVSARDTAYDDKMGKVQPVDHYAIATGSRVNTTEHGYQRDFAVHSATGTRQSRPPTALDNDIMFGLDNPNKQIQFERVIGSGSTFNRQQFDPHNIAGRSIVPRDDAVNVSLSESDFDIRATEMNADIDTIADSEPNQSVQVSLSIDGGTAPLRTNNRSDMHVKIWNQGGLTNKTVDTNASGMTPTVTVPAKSGDIIYAKFVHEFDPDTDAALYTSQVESKSIGRNIRYESTILKLMTSTILLFVRVFLPTIILLAIITYGLTGQFIPDAIRRRISI